MCVCAQVDISCIEARHALARRLRVLAGAQTWAPHLERISADFLCRQTAAAEAAHKEFRPDSTDAAQGEDGGIVAGSTAPRKKKGSGGGPMRAFLHERHRGRPFTAQSLKEMHDEFKRLSEEELARYKALGDAARVAWKHGYASYGSRDRSRPNPDSAVGPLPGTTDEEGALVAQDNCQLDAQMALMPVACYDFPDELRKMTSRHYKATAAARQKEKEETSELARYCASVSSDIQPLCADPVAQMEYGQSQAFSAAAGAHAQWFPPCSAIVQARAQCLQ